MDNLSSIEHRDILERVFHHLSGERPIIWSHASLVCSTWRQVAIQSIPIPLLESGLIWSCRNDKLHSVKAILKNVYLDSSFNCLALMEALRKGNYEISSFILQSNVTINRNQWSIVLRFVGRSGNAQLLSLLLKHFQHPLEEQEFSDISTEICQFGNIDTLRTFFSDPRVSMLSNSQDRGKALLEAVRRNNLEIVQHLLKDGRFDPSIQRQKAFELACEERFPNIVEAFLKDSRIQTSANGNRAIRLACQFKMNASEVLELLLSDPRLVLPQNDVQAMINSLLGFRFKNCYEGSVLKSLFRSPLIDPSQKWYPVIDLTESKYSKFMMYLIIIIRSQYNPQGWVCHCQDAGYESICERIGAHELIPLLKDAII